MWIAIIRALRRSIFHRLQSATVEVSLKKHPYRAGIIGRTWRQRGGTLHGDVHELPKVRSRSGNQQDAGGTWEVLSEGTAGAIAQYARPVSKSKLQKFFFAKELLPKARLGRCIGFQSKAAPDKGREPLRV